MKYTVIFIAAMVLWWIWRFASVVMERGLPTHPVYYISAVIGVVGGFLTYRLMKVNITKRRYLLIPALIIVITIVFGYTSVEILQYIGSGLFFWYLLSSLGFYGFFIIRRWGSKKELTQSEQIAESMNKGLALIILVMAIIFTPILIFIFLMAVIFN
jgi:hypothetical protein